MRRGRVSGGDGGRRADPTAVLMDEAGGGSGGGVPSGVGVGMRVGHSGERHDRASGKRKGDRRRFADRPAAVAMDECG